MILKNSEIITRLNAMECLAEISLPVKIAYAMKKNHKKMMAEYEDYAVVLNELEKEYKEANGYIPPGKQNEYDKRLGELLSIEVDIDLHMISDEIFESGDFNMTLQQMSALDFMIE